MDRMARSGQMSPSARRGWLAVVMLAILLASAAGAGWLEIAAARRVRAAGEILADVRRQGLATFWSDQGQVHWRLIHAADAPVGWEATIRQVTDDGRFAGLRAIVVPGVRTILGRWTLNADATAGQYAGSAVSAKGERTDTASQLADGHVAVTQHHLGLTARSPAPDNYLPEGMMDLVVRRVAQTRADAQFASVFDERPNTAGYVEFGTVRVRYRGRADVEGTAVDVVEVSGVFGRTRYRVRYELPADGQPTILYDDGRRCVPAEPDAVEAAFPDASETLMRMMRQDRTVRERLIELLRRRF